jgi:hypothetical protein
MKDYEKMYQDAPTKMKMRHRFNRKGEEKFGYEYWNHCDNTIRIVEKFVSRNVGNKFDIVYSKFCNSVVPLTVNELFAKYWFWRLFKYTSYSDGEYFTTVTARWTPRCVYYINEDGNIARDVNKIKHSPKLFIDKTYTKYYQKSDFTKQGWRKLLSETKDRKRKERREYIKYKEEHDIYLLDIIENNRKQKSQTCTNI